MYCELCKGPGKVLVTSGTALREEISISKNPKTQKHIDILVAHFTLDEASARPGAMVSFNGLALAAGVLVIGTERTRAQPFSRSPPMGCKYNVRP